MELMDILQKLLSFESHLDEGKRGVHDWCVGFLEERGFTVETREDGCDPLIIARFGEPKVYFNGHIDVVPPGVGWTRKQGEVEGDIIYGRGTLDMKGPAASFLRAAELLALDGVPVGIILSTDEETSMKGAINAVNDWPGDLPEFVLICEPTGFRAMTQEKGAFHFTVKAEGKPAHGSMPERGLNSIDAIMDVYTEMVKRVAELENTTINIGTIHGGDKVNMVAQNAEMEIDIRFPPSVTKEKLEELLFTIEPSNGAPMTFVIDQYLDPWQAIPSLGISLIEELAGGVKYMAPYATEAVIFKDLCPTGVFGPGNPVGAHEVDEFIEISGLERIQKMYETFVRRFERDFDTLRNKQSVKVK